MKKKVLITGITGMVGSHLADYLYEKTDWDIYGMIRWRSPLENINHLISQINSKNRVHLVYGDLCDTISINHVVKSILPDYVFHLAAQSYPKTSFDAPLDTLDTNIQGTVRLLDAIKNYCSNALIHVCSSSEVYGRVPPEKVPIDEDCTFHPASPYAISKVGTDLTGRYYAEAYGMNIQVTRMFTHTGPRRGDVFAESSFAKQIALIEAGFIDPIIKVGNLDSLRTVADVRDAVRAYYLLLTHNPIGGESYNIGGVTTMQVREILDKLISFSTASNRVRIEVDPDRLRPIDADLQIPNMTKFQNHTGWKPIIQTDDTLRDLLTYWRKKIISNGNVYLTR
jgi:GDPmannose 4,6-dehydratase